jgi:F-type H+-transporting ATPase subunit gamma
VTSSLGLCGAFNINACKHLMGLIQPSDQIIVIGRKGYSYLRAHGLGDQITDFMEMSEANFNYLELLPTSELIMDLYNQGNFASVHIVYTKFINSITFTPADVQVLPLNYSLFKADESKSTCSYVALTDDHKEIAYDPSVNNILATCLPIYLTTLMFATIAESKVCENGARRNAMETATDNAKQLIEDLTLQFNRARQENITQEINEIVAGAGS